MKANFQPINFSGIGIGSQSELEAQKLAFENQIDSLKQLTEELTNKFNLQIEETDEIREEHN